MTRSRSGEGASVGVTSADVARRAGLSRATVSYVLNNTEGKTISPETRETVLRVARELGYHPNALARSLKRGRSNTVLLPLRGLAPNHLLGDLFTTCTEALSPHGLSLVLDLSFHRDPMQQATAWSDLAPAAILDLVLPHDDAALAEIKRREILVLSPSTDGETSWESTADRFAREQRLLQVDYLIKQGHRRAWWVIPESMRSDIDPRVTDRLQRDVAAAAAAGDLDLSIRHVELEGVAAAVAKWNDLPSAVMAHNDVFAVAVVAALQSSGLDVPGDVAVIGADDDVVGRAISPRITTVGGNFAGFARAVSDAVVTALDGGEVPPLPAPSPTLWVRESA